MPSCSTGCTKSIMFICALLAPDGCCLQVIRTQHCKIVRLMLCFIPVEKTAAGTAAKQDTQRQGTKEQREGMQ